MSQLNKSILIFIVIMFITPCMHVDAAKKTAQLKIHTVQSWDTPASIAKQYHISQTSLRKWNALVLDATYAGDHLVVSNPADVQPKYTRSQPDLDTFVDWFKVRKGKVRYVSWAGRWGPDTWDCSSSLYEALIVSGYLPKQTVLGDTTTMFAQEGHLFTRIAKKNVRYGDIFISGNKENSRGALGHTGVVLSRSKIIHMAYNNADDNGIMITSYKGYAERKGVPVYYYRLNTDYAAQLKSADLFENSLSYPILKSTK